METLKKEILAEIPSYDSTNIVWHDITEFEDLIYEKNGCTIYGDALQAALNKYKCIRISKREKMYLEKPLVMKSGYRLLLDKKQHISNLPNLSTCMIRNENIINGECEKATFTNPNTDISVDGGIWDGGLTPADGEDKRLGTGLTPEYKGALSIMIFINIENLIIKNAEFVGGGINYAVQLGCVRHFRIGDLTYIRYGRDGVHVNGPAAYGEICDLYGEDMGDDIVALNAWDWDNCAITFGTIEKIYVHDNKTSNNELRLLPGRKMYGDSGIDCDVRDCVLERLSGIYTFKLYCQPNILNAENKNYHDVSGSVGRMGNVWFSDIDIDKNRDSGFHGLPMNGIFDVGTDCNNIHFNNIRVLATKADVESRGLKFMSIGPLSAVWKNGSENPDDWGEVFSPNDICHAENIYFTNITFEDGKATTKEELTKEVKMTVNPDYPNTTPKGGTGYGSIGKVYID